ncbi:hypothetical protein KHQ06_24505 [Nocardia tengchongensis]|uniref:Uncharacterized protein n=1 Tax=Nocardia tengchongensis TaxID=2055889 RepID=A0ABX8CKS3_9NOCA|nr:hypothetical protein [Nocardia tengchongensis]QVI19524.1 hypothetical protein KHQ06_24505 [Nocardia tengchongensis]
MSENVDQSSGEPTPLTAPSATHKVVLREIQNTAKQCTDMLEAHRRVGQVTGTIAPDAFYSVYQRRNERGRELEDIARAGGVPENWITHVRTKGEQSTIWHDVHKYWPTPEPVDRRALIENVSAEARTLRLALAVSATGKIFDANGQRLWPVGALNDYMGASWKRISGIGALLNLTAPEREQIWPTSPGWAYTAVATVRAWDHRALTDWRDQDLDLSEPPEAYRARLLAELPIAEQHPIVPPYSTLVDLVGAAHRNLEHPTERLADDTPASAVPIDAGNGEAIAEAVAAASLDGEQPPGSGFDDVARQPGEYRPPLLEAPGPEP